MNGRRPKVFTDCNTVSFGYRRHITVLRQRIKVYSADFFGGTAPALTVSDGIYLLFAPTRKLFAKKVLFIYSRTSALNSYESIKTTLSVSICALRSSKLNEPITVYLSSKRYILACS